MTRRAPVMSTRLELHYSRPVAISVLVLASALLLVQGSALLGLSLLRGVQAGAWIALALVAPLYAWVFRYVLRALTEREPVVVLDLDGIQDRRKRDPFLAWDDVQRVRLGRGDKAHYLCLDYTPAAAARLQSRLGGWWAMLWRATDTLGDWNLYLGTLSGSCRDIERSADALRRASIRRRVERLNARAQDTAQQARDAFRPAPSLFGDP